MSKNWETYAALSSVIENPNSDVLESETDEFVEFDDTDGDVIVDFGSDLDELVKLGVIQRPSE